MVPTFQPSVYSEYGDLGAARFAHQPGVKIPVSQLTPSATAVREGISNKPESPQAEANLHTLSNFLARIPFPFYLNSAYRSPRVNEAVGGAGLRCSRATDSPYYRAGQTCSFHTSGLAADIEPVGMSNKELAAWFYQHRKQFPNLDQVIWYKDTRHLHLGLDPRRARAYKSDAAGMPLSGSFYSARKEGSAYVKWAPTGTEAVRWAKTHPIRAGLAASLGLGVITSLAVGTIGLALLWRYRDQLR